MPRRPTTRGASAQAGPSHGASKGDNGAILFVFVNDHQMFIATGRGLEGALPDITCKQIITNEIAPAFRNNDYAGGIQAGVNAMLAATRGEYQGNGQTHQEEQQGQTRQQEVDYTPWIVFGIFITIFVLQIYFRGFSSGPTVYTGAGAQPRWIRRLWRRLRRGWWIWWRRIRWRRRFWRRWWWWRGL